MGFFVILDRRAQLVLRPASRQLHMLLKVLGFNMKWFNKIKLYGYGWVRSVFRSIPHELNILESIINQTNSRHSNHIATATSVRKNIFD